MRLPENSYGRAKRLDFICASVERTRPREILDIGCGAGTQLTAPLAAAFPQISVIGVDEDARSLAWARTHVTAENLAFATPAELAPDRRFELIIASEVLEHVGDPVEFLRQLIARLTPEGRLLVTVPNGYGVFEWMALAEVLLNRSGLQTMLRRLKGGRAAPHDAELVTLANSPHVNFFSFRELGRLFAAVGLAVERYRPRTVLCGYLLDSLLRHPLLVAWNARLADRLPSWCASDWMFELRVRRPPTPTGWRRGAWARWRKRLNEQRWSGA
jgi:SAM-dependent methyltransferase